MADLYIRWSTASPVDTGVRPLNPCWPPNAFWTNASIWMSYPPNHPSAGATVQQARIGEEVLINVNAYSRGADFPFPLPGDARFVFCQVWACTGANGVGPISALASSGGPSGIEGIVFGDIYASINDYGIASVLWTPDAADNLAFDANGAAHVCLAANLLYLSTPGASPASQGQRLPQFQSAGQPVQTIFPCGDGPTDPRSLVPIGHFHGQKNIQVLSATAPGLTASMSVIAGGERREKRLLQLVERTGPRRLEPALREHLLAHAMVELSGGNPREQRTIRLRPEMLDALDAKLARAVRKSRRLPAEPLERARLAGGGRLVLAEQPGVRLTPARRPLTDVAIQGGGATGTTVELTVSAKKPQQVTVDLQAAEADKPGTVRVFDLVERDENKRLVGGTTFVTLAQ